MRPSVRRRCELELVQGIGGCFQDPRAESSLNVWTRLEKGVVVVVVDAAAAATEAAFAGPAWRRRRHTQQGGGLSGD